jgi:tRNA (mo5U34)-methyltransferase
VDDHYLRQARWAAEQLDPHGRVEFSRMTVYALAELDERFDLVLFLGVLYHLRHPLLALDIVADRVGGRLVLQTLTMPGDPPLEAPEDLPIGDRDSLTGPGGPRAAFIEHHLAGDPTNWWAPDDACVQAMLRSAGMRVTAIPDHEIYVCEPDPEHDHARFFRAAELDAVLKRRPGT